MVARRFAKRSGPRNLIWTVVLIESVTVATTALQGENIVTASDWSVEGGFERATLLAIRGYVTLHNLSSAANDVKMCIAKQGDGEPTIDAAQAATYSDEDILWTGGVLLPAVATAQAFPQVFDINVKFKRKITIGDDIAFFIAPNGGSVIWSCVLRALVDKG